MPINAPPQPAAAVHINPKTPDTPELLRTLAPPAAVEPVTQETLDAVEVSIICVPGGDQRQRGTKTLDTQAEATRATRWRVESADSQPRPEVVQVGEARNVC